MKDARMQTNCDENFRALVFAQLDALILLLRHLLESGIASSD